MRRTFINRHPELEFLRRKYGEEGFQFLVIYGRRRVGKTEVIKQSLKGNEAIYYLADKRGTEANARMFVNEVSQFFRDVPPSVENFDVAFEYLARRAGKKRVIVIIDEFSYLVERDSALPSVFQKITDNILKDTNIVLILCGSSISMMEKGVLSYQSPLYGRRTGEWKILPLGYSDALKFFPRYSFAERVTAALLLGGIPAYLNVFDDTLPIIDNIRNKLLLKGEFLFNEPNIILQEELRDPSTYLKMLDSISNGSTKVVDIASKSYLDAKDLPKYLAVLQKLGYVKKIKLVTEKKPTSKKTIYKLSDNFFQFWFKYVNANKNDLELGKIAEVVEKIKNGINQFLGIPFESFCQEFLLNAKLPMKIREIGPWWGHYRENGERKEVEIDIVGLNEDTSEILFCECKWQNNVNAENVLEELREKSKFVEWHNEKRKEHYCIIAKSFKEKPKIEGCLFFDLKDAESVLL